jgi:hypothetical protein
MFGFRKKTEQPDTQIPYQVYESVHEPAARRQRWLARLAIALLVATLLVVGLILLRNARGGSGDVQEPGGQAQQVQQAPQANPPQPAAPGEAARTPLSDGNNDRTVDQPQ